MKNLRSSAQPSIPLPLTENSTELDEAVVSTIPPHENEQVEVCPPTCKSQTLPGGTGCTLPGRCISSTSVEPADQLNKIDDGDDELIPSSQNTPNTSSRRKRRSRVCRTPKNNRKQSLSREKSKNDEVKNTVVDKMETESLVSATLTDDSENSSAHDEMNKNGSSMSELVDSKENESSKTTLEAKKTSPIASRTRFRRNPTPYKINKPNCVESLTAQETIELIRSDTVTDMEEYSDHQMDDTQIVEPPVVQVPKKTSDNDAKETEAPNETPSSPVPSSSIKFVKTSATGSPLNRPHRSFSSPACSPTTGILKRNRGKSETPSPPGKVNKLRTGYTNYGKT
jgi:hypothetical protein